MSLTAELVDDTSPLHTWLTSRLPNIDAIQHDWTRRLGKTWTVYPRHDGDIDWAGIGTRLRLPPRLRTWLLPAIAAPLGVVRLG